MDEHDFDILAKWSRLTDPELTRLYSEKAKAILDRIVQELDEGRRIGKIDASGFCDLVRMMRKRYEDESRALGEAIVTAAEHRDNGRDGEANQVLERFARTSPSPFYRRIALNYRR